MHTFSRQSYHVLSVALVLVLSWSMTSCISAKKVVYFTDVPDSNSVNKPFIVGPTVKYTDPVILTNDLLAITVQTVTQGESNTPISSSTASIFNPLNGFLVDKNGNIEIALVGFVHVAGLTTSEARELIKEKAKEFYKDPVVNLRIANFDIQFMGEFNHPGTFTFPAEKVNIVEAIAAAGDLAITAKRNNILLIRSEGDQKKFVRFSMSSSDIFKSEYFYMRQRDILYATPTRSRIQNSDNTILRNVSVVSSLLGLAGLILAFRPK